MRLNIREKSQKMIRRVSQWANLTTVTRLARWGATDAIDLPSELDAGERAALEDRVQQRTAELQTATEIARSALADAEQADRLKDTFLAMASHELRSPLQATLYWAEMLRRNPTPELTAEAARHIIDNVQVQSRLIDDLLDISRILTGQLSLEWRRADPVDVVQKAVDVVRIEASVRGIRIELECPSQPVSMTTDPVRLEQVAWNLMSNAVHASPDGATVHVRVGVKEDLFCLEVQDHGVGIPPDQIPQIFKTFRQGACAAPHGGLGLGLPITHSIVRQFDGHIEASSEGAGKGALFRVELPLQGAASATVAAPAPMPFVHDLQRLRGMRVLYVEHKPEAADSGRLVLESLGVQVEHCASFDQAMRRLPLDNFDVLLSAVRLDHGHSGEELVQHLRVLTGLHPVAVSLSAGGSKRDVQSTSDSGFSTHVVMPVTGEELGRALLDALNTQPAG